MGSTCPGLISPSALHAQPQEARDVRWGEDCGVSVQALCPEVMRLRLRERRKVAPTLATLLLLSEEVRGRRSSGRIKPQARVVSA